MKKYDVVVIGLGPAGMAVASMAAEMDLTVLAVESRKLGNEAVTEKTPILAEPFVGINADIGHLRENKIASLMEKADVILGEGTASFVSSDTIRAGGKEYSGKHIFIATGTRPFIPPIKGLDQVDFLTNENLYRLEDIPESLTLIGGGAIGCEMAQAFAKAGCKCAIVHDRPHLLPNGEKDAGELLEQGCKSLGIRVCHSQMITRISKGENGRVLVHTRDGLIIESEKLMVAAGRSYDFSSLNLESAGVKYGRKGILVDDYLRTTTRHIHAIGDCNGSSMLSHSAMHQGMQALMNTMTAPGMRKKCLKKPSPWTVFTDPQVSHVGKTTAELDAEHLDYEVVEAPCNDSENEDETQQTEGRVRVYCSPAGRIYGVSIAGGNAGEMIDEWALAIQHDIGFHDLMMTMHSFPTIGSFSRRIGKTGMMKKIQPGFVKKLLRFLF